MGTTRPITYNFQHEGRFITISITRKRYSLTVVEPSSSRPIPCISEESLREYAFNAYVLPALRRRSISVRSFQAREEGFTSLLKDVFPNGVPNTVRSILDDFYQ